ncbi:MAG: MFS transporter [Legionellaceae bacterium]|nr:MFS transporter [Legionellaceae bacterium]
MSNQFKTRGFLVWGICAFFFLYDFLLRTVMGTFQPSIMKDLHLTSFQFSLLSTTIFFLIYGLMQIPAGIIIDKVGLKKSLAIASFTCAIASIGISYSYNLQMALLFRMLMGLGASFGFIGLLMSVNEWMPHKYLAVFIGLSQFIGTIGPMIAAGPLDGLSETSGISWRYIFVCLGFIGFALTTLIFLFVKNNQEKANKYVVLYKSEKVSSLIKKIFSRSQPWFIAILAASLYFAIEYLSDNEGRVFLSLKGIPLTSASYMITISWVGYAIGCPLLGFISDILQRRKVILFYSAVLGLISILSIFYLGKKEHLQIAFFFLGVSASGQSICYALIAEQFKKQFIAVGFGLTNGMVTVMAAINSPLIGLLLDKVRNNNLPALNDYLIVFYMLIFTSLIGLVTVIFFIKETFCKSVSDFTYLKPS